MATAIIIQARTGSSRLPNKMLMPFHNDKGILEILLTRILNAFPKGFTDIIVATTTEERDNPIETLCKKMGVKCFRGSENDVLSRFIAAADHFGVNKLIRVCADNVFLDTDALKTLYYELDSSSEEYISFRTSQGIPSIKTHYGFWAEGVSTDALKKVMSLTDDNLYHEHVTNFIYAHPETFSVKLTPIAETIKNIEAYPRLRLTIDTSEDFEISRQIFEDLLEAGQPISTSNILSYLDEHTELFDRMETIINQNSK